MTETLTTMPPSQLDPGPPLGPTAEGPQVHGDTFGLAEVILAEMPADINDPLEPSQDLASVEALRNRENREKFVSDSVDEIRGKWGQLSESDRIHLSWSVAESTSVFQNERYKRHLKTHEGATFVDWLIAAPHQEMPETNEAERAAKAVQHDKDNLKILNFLQSHVHNLQERQQEPWFLERVEKQKTIWLDGVRAGVEDGRLDESALVRAERLASTKVYQGDFFSTTAQGVTGYHKFGSSDIVVGRWGVKSVPHELNHALLDGRDNEENGGIFNHHWLNEAVTEYISMYMNYDAGNQDAIEGRAYSEVRSVLSWLVVEAQKRDISLNMHDFTRAYSSEGEEREERMAEISDKLSELFGGKPDIVADIQTKIIRADKLRAEDPKLRDVNPTIAALEATRMQLEELNPTTNDVNYMA